MQAKIDEVNKDAKSVYASAQLPRLPAECESRSRPVEIIKDQYSVGELHETPAASGKFRATPAMDALTLEMAKAAVDTLELGKGKSIDVLAVSFSATDYAGHYFGSEGAEMCTAQLALDKTIEELLNSPGAQRDFIRRRVDCGSWWTRHSRAEQVEGRACGHAARSAAVAR